MTDVTIRLTDAPIALALMGTKEEGAKKVSVTHVTASRDGNIATLELDGTVSVPLAVLIKVGDDTYRLKTPADANKEKAAGALAKVRRALAKQDIKIDGNVFFGLPAGTIDIQASLSIAVPESGKITLTAKASQKITADIQLANFATASVEGRLEFAVKITEDDVLAAIDMVLPDHPQLGFSLTDFKLPNLTFSGLDIPLPTMTALKLPMPDWLPDDLIKVSGGAPFALKITGNGVAVTASMPIKIQVTGVDAIKVANFAVAQTGGDISVKGEVSASADITIDKTFPFGGADSPVRGGLHVAKAFFKTDGTHFTITWNIARLWIEATNDPDTRIAVTFDLTTKTTIADGGTDWDLTDLNILDLGGKIEVPKIEINDDWIKTRFGAFWNEAKEFLRKLLRLIGAVAQWLGETLGPIPGLLAELAETLGSMLADALLAILNAIGNAQSFVTIELRLDAATLRPLQVIVTVHGVDGDVTDVTLGGSYLKFKSDLSMKPALILDFEHNWQGLALLSDKDTKPQATVSTNLWMDAETDKSSSIPQLKDKPQDDPLIAVTATMKSDQHIVMAALQHGQARFFQKFASRRVASDPTDINGKDYILSVVDGVGDLSDLEADDVDVEFKADKLKDKLLALMPQGPETGGGPFESLGQFVKVGDVTHAVELPHVELTVPVEITVAEMKVPVTLKLSLNINTMHAEFDAGDEVFIEGDFDETLFGLKLHGTPGDKNRMFLLSFADGDASLSLAEGAKVEISYDRLSSSGSGLKLDATEFRIGRGGLDLTAKATDHPVRLAGLDQPFRFTSGSIVIRGGQLQGGTISGNGPMPPALIGEANAEIDIVFGRRGGRLAVIAANAKLEKEGEPLYSTGTKFKITLDALGLAFREPEVGPVQFFFQLWGSASFEPAPGEFDGGLLKNIRSVAIKLDGAPLAGDGRELIKHISFLVELDPPLRESLFDIFGFELRGIAFYPASKSWPDTPPAIGLNGQVSFLEAGDVVSSEIDFHELLLAPPEPGGSVPLPRIRADGLSVLLRVGGIAQVEATAVAVDGTIPSIYAPVAPPANVTADGFLAAGRIDISGLGAFGGAMGFLELRKDGIDRVKHAMFLYGQAEKLTERIDTPIGPLFIREAGFGFGKNYTLTAMAAADGARSPRQLVKALDEVSKLQGNLTNFNAWTPQYDKDAVTIALRGMISLTATSTSSASYDAKGEKELANPLLMDIVLGLRTDFTFFANIRGWLAYNYNDWFIASSRAAFKERPTLRGYLYFSLPRKELLARFLSDPTGMIGNHPELDKNLVKAIQSTRFAATLYIRPGLYHCEFGWPYELGFTMGNPSGNFHLDVSGGLVLRIEDATMLYGLAFKALGHMQFGGSVGNANFGASAVARADFLLGARFIAYITPLNPKDTLFYGEIYLNLSLRISVNIWMSFKIFRKRFTLRIGFSIGLTISVSAEVVLSGRGVGAKVHAAVGVSGFGRTLSVGVGFSFGDSKLADARARVARFMDLGLGIDPPKENALAAPAPAAEVKRARRATASDKRLDTVVPQLPAMPPPEPGQVTVQGTEITESNFWALLFYGGKDDGENETYLMMLVPRDRLDENDKNSTFYAEPFAVELKEDGDKSVTHIRDADDYTLRIGGKWAGLRQLTRDGTATFKPSEPMTGKHGLQANLKLTVGQSELGPLDFNALMAECFLDPPDETRFYGEPYPITHGKPKRKAQQAARDQRVSQASRNVSSEKLQASLVAEEKRSALITKAGESAFELAQEARRRIGETLKNKWTFSASDLAAPDFGLAFIVTKDQLPDIKLFDEDEFAIEKRVRKDKAWTMVKGSVTLLNHPNDAFDQKQPRLDDARVEVDQDGFKLLWDLEPAFGASDDMPFAEDPETLLAHYRIERSFEGSTIPWTADFLTRTATPLEYSEGKNNTITTTRSRARMHLCDDFSLGDVPEDLRAMLIGAPIPSGRNPIDVWSEAFGSSAEASVVYKVVAVDIMGTETDQRVLEKRLTRPAMRATAPLNAEMLVEYKNDLATLGDATPAPDIELTIDFRDDTALQAAPDAIYQMRVRTHTLRGGGQFGADALDDSQNRPGQADIDGFRDGIDKDLFFARVAQGGLPLTLTIAPKGDEDPQPDDTKSTRFGVFDSIEEAMAATEQTEDKARAAIAAALHVPTAPTPADQLRAARVFLRNLGDKRTIDPRTPPSGPWLIVQTQLRVLPAKDGAPTYSATVELLESPLKVPFEALGQEQIARQSGRLELVYPNAAMSFGDFLDAGQNDRTLRRLDPDLRSAIRLDFNASAARMATGDPGLLNGLVAGFDIFSASPARLRMRGDSERGVTTDMVIDEARKRATVKVLPRSLGGLFPDKLPDFRNIEVRYPSETLRTNPDIRGNRPRARWYSNAESLVAFPHQRLRRSLFPITDEMVISSLLDEFRATKITVSMTPVTTPAGEDAKKWGENFVIGVTSDMAVPSTAKPEPNRPIEQNGNIVLSSSAEEGVKASELRAMLRGLVFKENADLTERYRAWRRDGSDPDGTDLYRVRVEITANDGADETKQQEVEVNLAAPLHPVVADTLDTLCYKHIEGGSSGQVYRAYEVELEPVPPQETKGFDALLDSFGPSGDPYGWSALRVFGLAAGFRVYDIDEARFLIGEELFEHVNACFTAALGRYHHEVADLGHPFVELVDLPETFMGISSMDDRSNRNVKDVNRIIDGDTAILQIGLRPRAAQQSRAAEVRYLAVNIADADALQTAKDNPAIDFPDGFIFDSVGLPDAGGKGDTRFATGATAKLVFDEQADFPAKATLDLDSLKSRRADETCFVLRATRIDRDADFETAKAALGDLIDVGLDVGDWHAHPGDEKTFETFAALEPILLGFLQGRRTNNQDVTPLETLLEWLPPDHLPDADIAIGDVASRRDKLEALLPLVARVSEWTARFLAHGAAQTGPDGADMPKLSFAFAAMTSEDSFARVPDANGRVSAFFIDPARLGREYYFAIRPFGRYTGIETMLSGLGERPVTLAGGLPQDWKKHFAAVSLDRTKPPEPPAILAARRSGEATRNEATGVELIVARTPDQIASEANLDAERALQGGWTGLELRAHYPATDLAKRLLEVSEFDPFAAFDEANFTPASDDPKTHVQVFTPEDLASMRQAAPDAWRGSIRFDLSGLPHFFDTFALVHQSAGAVVSDISSSPLPRAGRIPSFPPLKDDASDHDGPSKDWGLADQPTWTVKHFADGQDTKARIAFDLPMMRNLDLIHRHDLLAWTGGIMPAAETVYFVPDPSVSYRVSTESADFSTTVPQLELLPAQTAADVSKMYTASLSGDRFAALTADTLTVAEQTGSDKRNWRLQIAVDMPDKVPAPTLPDMPALDIDAKAAFRDLPSGFDPGKWAEWAPIRSFGFTVLAPDQAAIAKVVALLQPFAGSPTVDALIADLQNLDLEPLDRIEGWLPLGLAIPDLPTELSEAPADVGAFVWPENGAQRGLTDADTMLFLIHATSLDTDAHNKAKTLLTELQANWMKARTITASALGPVYEATAVTAPQSDLAPPFAHFRMLRYARKDGKALTADIIQALINAIQSLSEADPFILGSAVQSLREVTADALLDVTLPLPTGSDAPMISDLNATEIGETFAGLHWLPDTKTLMTLDEANALRATLFRISRDMVFGKNTNVRLTGFAGSDGAKSVGIHQKGERP